MSLPFITLSQAAPARPAIAVICAPSIVRSTAEAIAVLTSRRRALSRAEPAGRSIRSAATKVSEQAMVSANRITAREPRIDSRPWA